METKQVIKGIAKGIVIALIIGAVLLSIRYWTNLAQRLDKPVMLTKDQALVLLAEKYSPSEMTDINQAFAQHLDTWTIYNQGRDGLQALEMQINTEDLYVHVKFSNNGGENWSVNFLDQRISISEIGEELRLK